MKQALPHTQAWLMLTKRPEPQRWLEPGNGATALQVWTSKVTIEYPSQKKLQNQREEACGCRFKACGQFIKSISSFQVLILLGNTTKNVYYPLETEIECCPLVHRMDAVKFEGPFLRQMKDKARLVSTPQRNSEIGLAFERQKNDCQHIISIFACEHFEVDLFLHHGVAGAKLSSSLEVQRWP